MTQIDVIEAAAPSRERTSAPTALGGAASDAAVAVGPRVTFAGSLAPPVTGMTAMNTVIVNALQDRGDVRVINWSRGTSVKGWRWKLIRVGGALRTLALLLCSGRVKNTTLYYPVSQGAGLYYDLAVVSLACFLGYRIAIHHHAYTYIDRRDWRMAYLARVVDVHAVHCDLMRQDFLRRYDTKGEFWIVPPTIVSKQLDPVASSPRTSFVLGFLSNVTFMKGIDEAILVFERLAKATRDVRLIIAGPCQAPDVQQLVDATVANWPGRVEYRGPVYDDAKRQFFADIDALVFPTRFRAESWGIVLTEALAAGRPALTRARGCVPWIIDSTCGLVVAPEDDFVGPASELVTYWMDSPEHLATARAGARQRSKKLEADAEREFPQFVERFYS